MREQEGRISKSVELVLNGEPVSVHLANGRIIPKLCFLGPKGTHTEEAVNQLLGPFGESLDADQLKRNRAVVKAVDSQDYDLGLVALINATEGPVMETQRALINAQGIEILGETVIPVQHMLLGRVAGEIKKIYSHPQALGQCGDFLDMIHPDAEHIATASTSEAIEKIMDSGDSAVIAGRAAAEKYRLPIIHNNVGDSKSNSTRFVLIGRGETQPSDSDTTLFTFIPAKDRSGILRDCLTVFSMYGINLSMIQTHPTGQMDNHIFFASLDGHKKDENVALALKLLQDYCSDVKVLGSYKKAPLPEGFKEPDYFNGSDS